MQVSGTSSSLISNGRAMAGCNGMTICRNGLELSQPIRFRDWERLGQYVLSAHESSSWWVGDWLVYGQEAFRDRYQEALHRTSLDYQTLRNYAWVARRFELSRRRDNLSFGHHAEVAALPPAEQDYWLRKAQNLDWSRNRLRIEVKRSLRERNDERRKDDSARCGTEPRDAERGHAERAHAEADATEAHSEDACSFDQLGEDADATYIVLRLEVGADQASRFRQAADREKKSLEEWAVVALEVASNTLANRQLRLLCR